VAQFDVYRTHGPAAAIAPFLVVMQADTLQAINSVIVAPMYAEGAIATVKKLHVVLEFQGARHVVTPEHLVSLPRKALGSREGSVGSARSEFIDALDFIFSGY